MKKVFSRNLCLCVGLVSMLGASALRAAPVLTGPVASCLSLALSGGSATDSTSNFATLTTPGFACEQQDKIFSNFAVSAGVPSSATVRFSLQTIAGSDFHTVTLGGNFGADFTFSYDIAIDPTFPGLNSALRIVRVTGDLVNSAALGNPTNVKTVLSEGGTMLGTTTSSALGAPGTPIFIAQTAVHVVDTYTANGGAATAVANTFQQSAVPEPVTNALVGGGLLLLGWARRKRRF